MKKLILFAILAILTITFTGCGETVNGVTKDAKRIGKGIKTIFVRDAQ